MLEFSARSRNFEDPVQIKSSGIDCAQNKITLNVQPKHEFRAAEFQLRVDPRLQSGDGRDAVIILASITSRMDKQHKRQKCPTFTFPCLSGRRLDS